jgi:hypothetical protein
LIKRAISDYICNIVFPEYWPSKYFYSIYFIPIIHKTKSLLKKDCFPGEMLSLFTQVIYSKGKDINVCGFSNNNNYL